MCKKDKALEAMALDGVFLATQYDVDWRKDLFTGWDFYDLSQCMEFYSRQYKVLVMPQIMPYCKHYCGANLMEKYDGWREVFLAEYREELCKLHEERERQGEG